MKMPRSRRSQARRAADRQPHEPIGASSSTRAATAVPPLVPTRAELSRLYTRLSSTGLVARLLLLARDEDLADRGDITSLVTIPPRTRAVARLVAREPGIIAGLAAAPEIIRLFAPRCSLRLHHADAAPAVANQTLATIGGPLREILRAERTLLNLVGRLSGIATRTRAFLRAMHNGDTPDPRIRAHLYDTRKTTPGLRVLEKYAVRCGGGSCHRIGLYDAVLIKDNHLAGVATRDLAAFVRRASAAARRRGSLQFIQVEVDTLAQFNALLTLPPGVIDIVLLDNMPPPMLRAAVRLRDRLQPAIELESSGGITLKTIRAKALTGVDRLSVGSLTHGAASLDVALDM